MEDGWRLLAADTDADADGWLTTLQRAIQQQREPIKPETAQEHGLARQQLHTQLLERRTPPGTHPFTFTPFATPFHIHTL